MKKSFLVALTILIATGVLCVVMMYLMAIGRGEGGKIILEPAGFWPSTTVLSPSRQNIVLQSALG